MTNSFRVYPIEGPYGPKFIQPARTAARLEFWASALRIIGYLYLAAGVVAGIVLMAYTEHPNGDVEVTHPLIPGGVSLLVGTVVVTVVLELVAEYASMRAQEVLVDHSHPAVLSDDDFEEDEDDEGEDTEP